jgi:hypothetical protein
MSANWTLSGHGKTLEPQEKAMASSDFKYEFLDQRRWRTASGQLADYRSIANLESKKRAIAEDRWRHQIKFGDGLSSAIANHRQRCVRALVARARKPRPFGGLLTMMLAAWQATSWSCRAREGQDERREYATQESRKDKMCCQTTHRKSERRHPTVQLDDKATKAFPARGGDNGAKAISADLHLSL